MRYKVVLFNQGIEMSGFGIWDEELSPQLQEAGVRPAMCSLDGRKPLFFRYMSQAWSWLAECERQGLDLKAGRIRTDVYADDEQRGGVVIVSHKSRDDNGPAVRRYPLKSEGMYDR